MKLILKYFILSLCILYPNEQLFYLKYEKIPDNIYKNQIFKVDLDLLVFDDNILHIESNMSNYYGIQIFDNSLEWKYKGERKNNFKSFVYIKSLSINMKLPDISIKLIGHTKEYSKVIKGGLIKSKSLNWLNHSSHLIGHSLEVLDYQSETYDKKHNIINIHLKTKDTNLEDWYIKNNEIIEQDVTQISYDYPYVSGKYYAIIPDYIKTFEFHYLNTDKNDFDTIRLDVTPDNKSSFLIRDIKPDIKTYDKYKLVFLLALIALCLFMAFYRKKMLYLIFTALLVLIFANGFLIHKTIVISKGSQFRVLPLDASTIFYISEQNKEVIVLNKTKKYLKVQLKEKVGWVNEKYILKD